MGEKIMGLIVNRVMLQIEKILGEVEELAERMAEDTMQQKDAKPSVTQLTKQSEASFDNGKEMVRLTMQVMLLKTLIGETDND
jgi:hypothetical protein